MAKNELYQFKTKLEESKIKSDKDELVVLRTKYGEPLICICGCNTFKVIHKDDSLMYNCVVCGTFCSSRRKEN